MTLVPFESDEVQDKHNFLRCEGIPQSGVVVEKKRGDGRKALFN